MDLGTVKARIHSYRNPEEVRADVQMVFDNAKKYNPVGTDVRKMSGVLEVSLVRQRFRHSGCWLICGLPNTGIVIAIIFNIINRSIDE